MSRSCDDCAFSMTTFVMGRDRLGCTRTQTTPDNIKIKPPHGGFSVVYERAGDSVLNWRAEGDICGPQGKHWTPK